MARICTHRPKMGLTFPFDRWMRGLWRPMMKEALLAPAPTGTPAALFKRDAVEAVWREYLAGRIHWSRPWTVLRGGLPSAFASNKRRYETLWQAIL